MSSVNLVSAKHTTRANNADRWFAIFHSANLRRRRLCTKKDVFCQVECVLHVACGVICRHIKTLKVIVVGFYLRAVNNIKSHRLKNVNHIVKNGIKWVKLARFIGLCRHCDINSFFLKLLFFSLRLHVLNHLGKSRVNLCFYGIYKLTHNWALFGRKSTHRL